MSDKAIATKNIPTEVPPEDIAEQIKSIALEAGGEVACVVRESRDGGPQSAPSDQASG